ncbi:MAG TPA: GGDEF domain-containing protein [Mycobacteriales bacterium]|jgi:diguanylate cyclase (GGDEF)-like protein
MAQEPARHTRPPEVWAMVAMIVVSAASCAMGAVAPMTAHSPVGLDAVLAVAGLALAAGMWRFGSGLSRPWFHAALLTCVAGSTGIIAVAYTPQGAVASSLSYLWVTLYAAFFLGRTTTRAYVVLVGVAHAAALVVNPFQGAAQIWVLMMITVAIGAEAVAAMITQLAALAETDRLTGLWNRAGLERAATRVLADAARRDTPLSVAVLDLDGFKLVNDRDGHAAGDRLLVDLATAWRGCLRVSDVLARHGGDEFVLLMPGTGDAETAAVLGRLRAASPTHWSAGTALARPGDDLDTLLARADRDLYEDKARGRASAVEGFCPAP